jgi:hypothetical protein
MITLASEPVATPTDRRVGITKLNVRTLSYRFPGSFALANLISVEAKRALIMARDQAAAMALFLKYSEIFAALLYFSPTGGPARVCGWAPFCAHVGC